ncbi:MAG TPA: AMP-binding protein [Candidatus Acidoferrales bacterium]|nr:AMP-binding protein [Candidatus Acidoferrales bacterium]
MAVIRPFDESRITRGPDGIARYQDRPPSLLHMLRATVDTWNDKEALVELGRGRIGYREFWDRAAHVAGGLRALGVRRGDRVAIRLGNGIDWCVSFFGIQMAGAVAVPINTRFAEVEVEYVVSDSGSKVVIMPGQPLPDGPAFAVEDLEPGDLSAIFYTSGTTGFPKGAMTTQEAFLANIETCRRVGDLPFDGTTRNLISVPLFHVTGCNSQLLPSCEGGGTVVIMPAFDIKLFLQAITSERLNSLTTVPAIFWLAINQPDFGEIDTSAISRVAYGGAPMPPDLVGRLMEAFPNARLGNGFGLTECCSVATFLPHEHSKMRPESVGFAAPVVDLKLTDVDPETCAGELLIRGPNVSLGYWNKPEATAETFVDHWLHTGDMARIDEQGFVEIVDRKKDMINRGGENVYCVEVENALAAFPAVFEAAVTAVPDTMMGEKVGAVIVPKPGQPIDIDELVAHAKARLADFKVPQYIVVRSQALPRNAGGKVLKKKLREHVDWGKPLW